MLKKFIDYLSDLPSHYGYWLTFSLIGLALLLAALYYQHILNEQPCVVCVQIRLWISLLIIASIASLLLRQFRAGNIFANLVVFITAVGLIERSYLLLGTERGFIFADCGFDLGLPIWLAVEEWLPWLYRVETSCGYTPEIIFGITMAEALMAMSVLLFVVSACVLVTSILIRE